MPPPLRKNCGERLSPPFFLRGGGRLYTGEILTGPAHLELFHPYSQNEGLH